MSLWRRILTATVIIGISTGNSMAARDCTNPTYRHNNPDECSMFFGGGVALIGTSTIAASAIALVGLSLGGGDGSAHGSTPNATYVQPTRSIYNYVGGDVDTAHLAGIRQEVSYQRNLDQYNTIRLAWSLARGFTGRGTEIAILDAGPDTWHGKTVAAFASGAVAPNATVREYKIADENMDFIPFSEIGDVIAHANTAHIYNASWSVEMRATQLKSRHQLMQLTDANFVNQISDAATQRDAIFVWAAGNDGSSQSSALSALPVVMPELDGHFINVVAYDDVTGTLADYSNACGITLNWCITAPGTLSTGKTIAAGTSFAAPIVSAAIAILREAFPYMTASQITSLLFETARDLGADGVDPIYGHGMLDLERATRPVGAELIPLDNGATQPLSAARASGQIAHKIKSANPKFAFVDAYGRAFNADLGKNISVQNPSIGWRHLRSNNIAAFRTGNIEFGLREMDILPTDGALGTNNRNLISFIGTTNTWDWNNIELFQTSTIGFARAQTNENSLITGTSDITTASVTFGANIGDFTFAAAIPDTVIGGNMTLRLPTGRAAGGEIIFNDYTIDLVARPSVEFTGKYRFLTVGFVDNPYGTDELFIVGKWKLEF